ncbi:MAG: hypothetical protein KF812_13395 [Fimbriimonadaceae bacterium]|nr:hypothetical protein [Fimbriimonadaceae bacterium]
MKGLVWVALGALIGFVACGALSKVKERREQNEIEDLSIRIQDRLDLLEATMQ